MTLSVSKSVFCRTFSLLDLTKNRAWTTMGGKKRNLGTLCSPPNPKLSPILLRKTSTSQATLERNGCCGELEPFPVDLDERHKERWTTFHIYSRYTFSLSGY